MGRGCCQPQRGHVGSQGALAVTQSRNQAQSGAIRRNRAQSNAPRGRGRARNWPAVAQVGGRSPWRCSASASPERGNRPIGQPDNQAIKQSDQIRPSDQIRQSINQTVKRWQFCMNIQPSADQAMQQGSSHAIKPICNQAHPLRAHLQSSHAAGPIPHLCLDQL
eukprot:2011579-Prymnesium_polylepis.1